ncbi:hypothetical protein FRC03_004333 [Tulasnella sp. 419]|nr:hypothetical protein FRC02_002371 [Tulasnella sp. 418]KAG8941554.1 hypothetical protein FRC03_004333 [Tulasnella sp. 419]
MITIEVGKKTKLKRKTNSMHPSKPGGVAVASSIARANTSRPASQQSNYTSSWIGKTPDLKKQPSKDKLNASFEAGGVAVSSSIA